MLQPDTINLAISVLKEKAGRLEFGVRTCELLGNDAPREARRDARQWKRLHEAIKDLQALGQAEAKPATPGSPKPEPEEALA